MHPAEIEKYIENPFLLNAGNIPELQKLVEEFPYFQAAHVLLTLAGKQHDALVFQQSLKKTAIVTSSRLQLFKLVEQLERGPAQTPEISLAQPPDEELTILKAAELSTDFSEAQSARTNTLENSEPVEGHTNEVEVPEIPVLTTEPAEAETEAVQQEKLEQEIGKQVVTSFVEKEILKTPEWNKVPALPEPESFGDWLSFLKKNNGQSYSEISGEVDRAKAKKGKERESEYQAAIEKIEDRKQKNKAIIDKIIETNPGLIRNKEEPKFFAPDLKAKESLLENEHLVTETLARIYALQGSVNKAVRAYEILSLKYPQKSAYFASLIQKLKNNQ